MSRSDRPAAGPEQRELPGLPSWEDPPAEVAPAVREIKRAIRARIAASGRSVAEVFGALEQLVAERAAEIEADIGDRGSAWPVVDYRQIAAGTVPDDRRDLIRRRGCLVVRGHFDRAVALRWDRSLAEYLDSNRFGQIYRGPGDRFFATVDSKPEIYPIYWSRPQMEARQSDRMATVQRFLNSLWTYQGAGGKRWFDPDRNVLYPDRVRRRPAGATSGGLGAHIDPGTLDLWLNADYQRAFRHVFSGAIEQFDPWDAAHRTEGSQFHGSTMSSVFRTFQGWTALSDMTNDQGVLHAVPIPEAIAYLLLRPLLDDVPDDDMCGVRLGRSFPVTREWHGPLLDAASAIPDVVAGDSVWWHGDLVHSVAPVADQRGRGNVMYIPAAPWCWRNERYAPVALAALETGSSPHDFPQEHYERTFGDRFPVAELNANGRLALGLAPAPPQ